MAGEAGTTLLVEIAKKAILPVVDITIRHFGYLVHYKSSINDLKRKADDLKSTRLDAENLWDSSANNNEEASNTSITWLRKVKAAETCANAIKEATEKPTTGCVSKWCPNLKQRYVLSRSAVKMVEEIQQLQVEGKDYVRSNKPALPPSKLTGASSNDCSKDFKTRSKIMDDIMMALEDDKISIIGVCGSGGVGKTTLMHELRERARVNDLFHEVAMITVSQNPVLSDIRLKLAEMLGLKRLKDMENEIGAADEIYKRLTSKGRRTLVILDDIWNEINLEELGIPVENDQTNCKVVLTSRQFGICNRMKVHTTITVAVMPPEEAWFLFRKTAGDCVESDDLKEIAKSVASECGGLPIALVTLAKALSNKKIGIWRDALKQLTEHSVTRIPDMDKKVYSSIKMSYNFLASEQPEAMPLLLLCCQLPEDAAIKVENLARYCLALRLFKNIWTLEGVRDIVCSLIEHLKSCFLLEAMYVDDDFDSFEIVRMHDIIRDVGLKEGRDGVYMQIVKQENDDVYKLGTSENADYQNIKILVQSRVDGGILNKSFLKQMEGLIVLEYRPDRYMPLPEFEGLTNLRMLSLEYAALDKDTVSKIGRLTKLELLIFRHCFDIGPFPRQIEQLSNLKLLDLRLFDKKSYPIPSGILPKLNNLEELYFGEYYFPGTPEDDEEGIEEEIDGQISELENLTNLKALQINLLDSTELLDLHFCFRKLQRFYFGVVGEPFWFSRYERSLILTEVSMEWILGEKAESIVRRTEQLGLSRIDDWTDPLTIEKFVSLQELELHECEHLEYLIGGGGGNSSVFTKLESLKCAVMSGLTELCHNGHLPAGSLRKLRKLFFHRLPKMRRLWVGPTDSLCFVNLTEVRFIQCGELEFIFPHSAAKCLVQLQKLAVESCEMLEGIVSNGEKKTSESGGGGGGGGGEIAEEPTDLILHFPKLREVLIYSSQNFRGFYNLDGDYDGSGIQALLSPLVMLPSLEVLQVSELDQLKHIVRGRNTDIPKFVASDWLQNLYDIYVGSCASLESVFDFKGIQVETENTHVVILGKLRVISLESLPNLTRIFQCKMQDISIPQLVTINVRSCHKLENIVASNLIKMLHNLERVVLKDCKALETVFDFVGLEITGEDECAILDELQDIKLENLPKLEHVCRLAPKEIHVFQKLTNLSVDDCGNLAYIFSSSVARVLEKVECLSISKCKSIKEVLSMNEECGGKKIVFRSLRSITLENLDKLSSFCSNDQLEFEFPSLVNVSIICCPEMKMFCYGRPTAEKLQGVMFASLGGKLEWKGDLNQTVQHFNARYQKENDADGNNDDDDDDDDDDEEEEEEEEQVDVGEDAEGSCNDNNSDVETVAGNVQGDGDGDENAKSDNEVVDDHHGGNNEVLDNSGTSSSTQSEQGTLPELTTTEEFHPNASEDVLTTSTECPLHSSDTHSKAEPEKAISDLSSDPDDCKSNRILIQGVHIKSKMKTTFEEILKENPNFLSAFRAKTDAVKTALVETAIHSLQILRQDGRLSWEQLEYVRNALDDLEASGLDVGWLERDYERANIVLDEEKVVMLEAELGRVESEVRKDAFEAKEKMEAFQMAKEKLEAATALRDGLKAKLDALKQGLQERKAAYY